MSKRVCPWWLGYLLASPLRRLAYNPAKILAPYVRSGMTVLEPGPGMGFFTLKRRGAGVLERVDARLSAPDSLGVGDLAGSVDFTLAFAVVHEMPSPHAFFAEVAGVSKPGASILFVEPAGHVSAKEWEAELQAAAQAEFVQAKRLPMRAAWPSC